MTDWHNSIQSGDCFDVLEELPDESVHAVVTDPPYGLAFMGRDWDDFEPREYQEWCEEWAQAAKRVLNPGGHLLAFSGNRTHHRLFTGVEDAGFEIRDTLTWHYGSGFPKATDVSKVIDKRADAERKVVGVKPGHEEFADRDTDGHLGGEGTHEGYKRDWMEQDDAGDYHKQTAPATDAAKKWDGWKTGLKPATEFICLARKPFDGATVDCVLEHGTGALNVDGCRVGAGERTNPPTSHNDNCYADAGDRAEETVEGRYPANLVLDPAAAAMLDGIVGETSDGGGHFDEWQPDDEEHLYGDSRTAGNSEYWDSGGPSRYFETHEWRDIDAQMVRFCYTSKATRAERTLDGRIDNAHPTVKPQDLMEWLVHLVTREGQVVLDPFAGSGTTCAAAKELGREFVGIERQAKWADVARVRVGLTPDDPSRVRGDDDQQGLEMYADGGNER